jgi:hypothetical protein
MLLILTLAVWPWTAFAQSIAPNAPIATTEIQAILDECDAILADVASQRDRAIEHGDVVETERDEARGQLQVLWKENERLRLEVEKAPSRVVWGSLGVGATVAVGVLVWWLTAL